MSNTLISVIIPVYNVEEYLKECLDSVINQTYDNIEIIAINDGSTDNSLSILESYRLIHENIIIISQRNSGQSVARNKGIEKSTGKYIYFLDSDDYILPETLENLVNTMEKNNLDLIRFSGESFTDNLNIEIDEKRYNFDGFFDKNKVYSKTEGLKLNLVTFSPSPVLYIIKKELLIKNKIFFKPGIIHEDDLFTVEIFLNSYRMMYNTTPYYKRRYRPNSTMTTKSLAKEKKSFNSRCIIFNELNQLFKKYNNRYEIKLIKQRRRSVLIALIYNHQNIEKGYKRKRIKTLDNLSNYLYNYLTFRKKISVILSKMKTRL